MNNLFQERYNQRESCITGEVSRKAQNFKVYLANEKYGPACFEVLGYNFGSNVGNEFGVKLRGKGHDKPDFAYNTLRIHSLMINTEMIEYNINGDTKAPLLRCFLFVSNIKASVTITTGQDMCFQTFSKVQFRPLLKNFYQSIHIDFGDTSGEKKPFVPAGITRHVLMFRKASNIHF